MTTGDGDLLASPLTILGLTLRSYNALTTNGISTVGDLLAHTEVDIATLPRIGPIVLAEIKAKLSANDLPLREGRSPYWKRR